MKRQASKATGWRRYPQQAPVTFEITTDTGAHRGTWDAGRLTLGDHSPKAEEVLRSLGGQPCQCMLVMDAITERKGDWALGADARHVVDTLKADAEFHKLPEREREEMLLRTRRRLALGLLPVEMIPVLDHARSLRVSRNALPAQPVPRSHTDFIQRTAARLLVDSVTKVRIMRRPVIRVECWLETSSTRIIYGSLGKTQGTVLVALRPRWINWVWRRGIAILDGHFVLDVSKPAPATSMIAQALVWEEDGTDPWKAGVAICHVEKNNGEWRLRWTE
jgi:hypothetical protein